MAQLKRASGDFRRAGKLLRHSANVQINLGNIAYLRGNFDRALQSYDRAIAWNIREPYKAYLNRGLTYERLGDTNAARINYYRALEENPQLDIARKQLQYIGGMQPIAIANPNRTVNQNRSGS